MKNIYLGELDTPQICTPAPKVPRRTSLVRNLKKAGRREPPPPKREREKEKREENRNSIPGELDTHTDARSAKKDVISTKPQKAMGAVRYSPEKDKEKHKPNLLPRLPLPYVAVLGACYLV